MDDLQMMVIELDRGQGKFGTQQTFHPKLAHNDPMPG